jgi:predicted SnoaL-like aldol condensation-catalyzing enzyme
MAKLWPPLRAALVVSGALAWLCVLTFLVFTAEGRPPPFPPESRRPVPTDTPPERLPDRALVGEIFEGAFARRDAAGIASFYADDAFLQDSWGTSHGKDGVYRYYATQFEYADRIELKIVDYLQDGNRVAITVIAAQDTPGLAIRLPAMVHLEFVDRKIVYQREYWDAAAYLDALPILGRTTRALRYLATVANESPPVTR